MTKLFTTIINQFKEIQLEQNTLLTKSDIQRILDMLSLRSINRLQQQLESINLQQGIQPQYRDSKGKHFDRLLSKELWNHTKKQLSTVQNIVSGKQNLPRQAPSKSIIGIHKLKQERVILINYVQTICNAIISIEIELSALGKVYNADQCQKMMMSPSLEICNDKQFLKQLYIIKDYYSLFNDYMLLIYVFQLKPLQSILNFVKKNQIFFKRNLFNLPENVRFQKMAQHQEIQCQIFNDCQIVLQNHHQVGLKLVLWLGMMMLGLQIILMFQKHHFFTLLVICSVLAIFLLNYFDAIYIKFVICNLLVSMIKDVLWLYFQSQEFWNIPSSTWRSQQQSPFLKFIIIIVFVMIFCKALQIYLLCQYWNIPQNTTQTVDFISLRFQLKADPKSNQITQFLISFW